MDNENKDVNLEWDFPGEFKVTKSSSFAETNNNYEELTEDEKIDEAPKEKLKIFNLKKVLVPIAIALLVGNALGFFAITLLKNKPKEDVAITVNSSVDENKNAQNKESTNSVNKEVITKNFQVSFVQAGVFSDELAAQNVKEKLLNSGPAILIKLDDKNYLFTAVANSLENAKLLAKKEAEITGQERYFRSIEFLGESKEKCTPKDKKNLEAMQENFNNLVKYLSEEKINSSGQKFEFIEVINSQNEIILQLQEINATCEKLFSEYIDSKNSLKLQEIEAKLLTFVEKWQAL